MDRDRRDLLRMLACAAAACPIAAAARAAAEEGGEPHRALFWEAAGDGNVRCKLCPRECTVADGQRGTCGVRENRGGVYYTLVHSRPCSMHDDPIEKKPLFHFRPGTNAFSLATVGCNLECRFCQNWEISQASPEEVPSDDVPPAQIVRHAQRLGSRSIAFTYSEPTVYNEYVRDVCDAAAGTGIGRVVISNGYIQAQPLKELLPKIDAIKIDFKAFSESFYSDVCGAHLRPVLDTLVRIREAGKWLELVMLTIPTLNDDPAEVKAMCRWIVQKLGPDVPVHFTRFHPMYKLMNLPSTPVATLERSRRIALDAGIRFAYSGNVPGHEGENTTCPQCKELLIRRAGFNVVENRIAGGKCPRCGYVVPGVWS
ncbi:MAG: AmmeMemoRadiSam system radical SAM enzyme [Proteobacteria bacterium]|nr:AmmeMemoRadiSam system radical SAM enzyme [Pseudomonadota bacterium]